MSGICGLVVCGKYQSWENLDSTFDFGSRCSDTGLDSDAQLTHEDLNEYVDQSELQSESSSDIDLSEDEEIWETSDEEISDGVEAMYDQSVQSILYCF